ncbi:KpsF/GutQ family sugar-phosphate isomerase [Flavobacterium columnare NBRC 100251 = ATCC 23463]|uniref:KpsF/GutQ family protein n=1 Tax=Flavobacterium columnare (strain ATCC 49512 / CIP 103533 / TG 44/87) TaxID=1041826 RepID=G8XAP1_FLACA|nr:KpsF/GutQ family sugar-phosphate isomerase [Flavobacterium columnare]AEW87347.1 KpsF/GutQ family protein [Flavobacterium columnare ATCC 49512]ANO48316.1 KpsF/GutQ family protein [Flavobacterium columnare]MBF6652562.1 KpsF/GutQ family sugar-phosphate isomerase [Flavobacterium columnare]MBF6658430.1 KpsF/GutQ family sugar-phosphate isomerase [Flavobacterium columnare]MEB3802252.1 KpsF/GutQ family sugar-phosphate isomerase [Flavobacterium columnare]
MTTKDTILAAAKASLLEQSEAIANLVNYLTDDFAQAVEVIYNTKGRLIVTGIGKSAIIAQKMVATFNSTGTPSMFLHASEAIHGDLGMVQSGDVIICISKSGNSPEIKVLVPLLKRFGNQLIGMTANLHSFLGKESDLVLHAYVSKESCPNNLAPTNSTTAQLVLGDALAICLMKKRDFKSEDFAKYHPGGALGKKLLLRVSDLLDKNHKPQVTPDSPIKDVIVEISEKRLGVTAVIEGKQLIGIITDGDIRRMLNTTETISGLKAKDIMTLTPKTIALDAMVIDAFHTMEDFSITQLVVEADGNYVGILHIHDILKEGII